MLVERIILSTLLVTGTMVIASPAVPNTPLDILNKESIGSLSNPIFHWSRTFVSTKLIAGSPAPSACSIFICGKLPPTMCSVLLGVAVPRPRYEFDAS